MACHFKRTHCDFESEHEQTETNQHVQIEVPEIWRGAFKRGETYQVRIESITKQEVALSEPEAKMGGVWDWVLVAAWIDTEGCFVANASCSTFTVSIYQKEKLPLIGICAFLRKQGVECTVYPTTTTDSRDPTKTRHGYVVVAAGPEDVAKVIRNTEPYIRTQNKRNQIAHFKAELAKPRKRLEERVIRSRLLLGIPPEGIPERGTAA